MTALTGKGFLATGGETFDPDTVGASAIFDGSADYLTLSTGSASGALSEFWVGCWALRTEFETDEDTHLWYSTGNAELLFADITDRVEIKVNGFRGSPSARFRDIGWYHVVFHFNGTSSELYVNGASYLFDFSDQTSSFPSTINNDSKTFYIGNNASSDRYNGYIAQSFYIEGSLSGGINDLAQTFTVGANGTIWAPKPDAEIAALAAAAGGNSYCLTDGIAAGTDASGNGNSFTPSGSPTASDNTPSKVYAILSPLDLSAATMNLTEGAQRAEPASTGFRHARSATALKGKVYWEVQLVGESLGGGTGSSRQQVGVMDENYNEIYDAGTGAASAGGGAWVADGAGVVYDEGVTGTTYTALSVNDHWCLAFDADNGDLWIRDDGAAWWGGGDPAAGTSPTLSGITTTGPAFPLVSMSRVGDIVLFKFTESQWTQTAPSGFKALNSANLTTPAYAGIDWFNTDTYDGNGSSSRSRTGVGFSPDFVWIKSRDNSGSDGLHVFVDRLRGTGKVLTTSVGGSEVTNNLTVRSFDVDGYTIGSDLTVNSSLSRYVAWVWRGDGTSGSTNNEGSITTTVSAAAPGHFSFGLYTGNNSGFTQTIGHGLPSAPEMVVAKARDASGSSAWYTWHKSFPATQVLGLSSTSALATAFVWGDTEPTDSVITIFRTGPNESSKYVFYAFRSVPGVCKVGGYTGNGFTDGPYVPLGFKPRWILIKRTDDTENWSLFDTARSPFNAADERLEVASSDPESTGRSIDILSDGFKLRHDGIVFGNASGGNYIYLAMAEVGGNGLFPPIPGR